MNHTWPYKDIAAKPAKGRYFALSFGESASQVTKLGLMDASDTRIRIRFENPTATDLLGDRFVFAAYRKGQLVVLSSWDEAVDPVVAKKATLKALNAFANLDDEPPSSHRNNCVSVWYFTERDAVGEIRFLKRTNRCQISKY